MKLSEIYRGCRKGGTPSLSKAWFVRYTLDGKPVQVRGGINKHKTIKEREKAAQQVKNEIDQSIIARAQKPQVKTVALPLKKTVEWAFNELSRRWGEASKIQFKSVLSIFYKITDKHGLTDSDIKLVTRSKMRELVEDMVREQKLGAHAYHKYKGVLNIFFRYLAGRDRIAVNPCDFVAEYRRPKPKPKVLLTDKERQKVREYLENNYPEFLNYLMVLFHTSIRPVEILRLKVENIDLKKGHIYLNLEDTKDDEARFVVIPEVLIPYLKRMSLHLYPKNYYVFGFGFLPQERILPMPRNIASTAWRTLIKEGLGINSNMYWLKDLGMRMKVEADVPFRAIREQAGHSTDSQSMVYVGKHLQSDVEKLKKNTKDF